MKTTTSRGTIRIDSVHVGEAKIDTITDPNAVFLLATVAYVNSESGQRLGSTNRNTWSQRTYAALQALLDAMEDDVLRDVFGESAAGSVEGLPITTTSGIPGL